MPDNDKDEMPDDSNESEAAKWLYRKLKRVLTAQTPPANQAVVPGVALEALRLRVDMWRTEAAITRQKCAEAQKSGRSGKAFELATQAAVLFQCAAELASVLPKPDERFDPATDQASRAAGENTPTSPGK